MTELKSLDQLYINWKYPYIEVDQSCIIPRYNEWLTFSSVIKAMTNGNDGIKQVELRLNLSFAATDVSIKEELKRKIDSLCSMEMKNDGSEICVFQTWSNEYNSDSDDDEKNDLKLFLNEES